MSAQIRKSVIYLLQYKLNGGWKTAGGYPRIKDARSAIKRSMDHSLKNHAPRFKPAAFRLLKEVRIETQTLLYEPIE